MSDAIVITGSWRGKMRTGISPFLGGGGWGEWENGIYCTGKGMNNFENGGVISLFRGLWLDYFTNFCTNKPFFGSGEIQLYISNISSNAWMKFCQFPCSVVCCRWNDMPIWERSKWRTIWKMFPAFCTIMVIEMF